MAYIKDIQKDTYFQKDRIGVRRHRAQRLWLSEDDTSDLEAACTACISEAGNVHPDLATELALVSVRARREGKHIWLWLNYDPVTVISDQPSPDVTVATIQITSMNISSWATGETIGETTPTPVSKVWNNGNPVRQPLVLAVPIWHIRVYFQFNTSQAGSNSAMVAKINSNAFSIGNRTFAAKTLLFQGVTQDVRVVDDDGPVVVFTGSFDFTHRPDGWYNYVLSNATTVAKKPMYESVTFSTPVLS